MGPPSYGSAPPAYGQTPPPAYGQSPQAQPQPQYAQPGGTWQQPGQQPPPPYAQPQPQPQYAQPGSWQQPSQPQMQVQQQPQAPPQPPQPLQPQPTSAGGWGLPGLGSIPGLSSIASSVPGLGSVVPGIGGGQQGGTAGQAHSGTMPPSLDNTVGTIGNAKAPRGASNAALFGGVATPLALACGGAAIYFIFCRSSATTEFGPDVDDDGYEDSDFASDSDKG